MNKRFKDFSKINWDLSSFINFCKAVRGQKYHKGLVTQGFAKLVLKGDYDIADQQSLIDHAYKLTMMPE